MILEAMLQRLYANLQRGPSLNARPHNSRQRVDLYRFNDFQSVSVDAVLPALLGKGRKITLPAEAPVFRKRDYPETEWSDEERRQSEEWERQTRLIRKLQDIAIDSQEYINDHGEDALFLGFPIISLPPEKSMDGGAGRSRVVAPAAFLPLNLVVRKGANQGATITAVGDGADLIIPNPALLAWLEQQTGEELPDLFEDDTGEDPDREFGEILDFVIGSLDIDLKSKVGIDMEIQGIPSAENLPDRPVILPSAVLGLFPMTNPGLLRDTKHMIEDEGNLEGPVCSFLCKEALEISEDATLEEEADVDPHQQAESRQPFEEEHFIAPIDPSQSHTADIARDAKALVIHGPPGTGKSQTITNIIGDHLARGERVLFVCDKRTALDVVKYRMDHCGLGHLCGVIHDPSRDRRGLYMGLRERMSDLVENEPLGNPEAELKRINGYLAALDAELKASFGLLHESDGENASFHDLVGQWLECRSRSAGSVKLEDAPGITMEMIDAHHTDLGEVFHRAAEARLSENPFFGNVNLNLENLFERGAGSVRESFTVCEGLAAAVDDVLPGGMPPLRTSDALEDQVVNLVSIADSLDALAVSRRESTMTEIGKLDYPALLKLRKELSEVREFVGDVADDLERELALQGSEGDGSPRAAAQHLLAVETYQPFAASVFRYLRFGKLRAAKRALTALALPLTVENVARAVKYFRGVKGRWLLSDVVSRLEGAPRNTCFEDENLRAAVETLTRVESIWSHVNTSSVDDPMLACAQSAFAAPDTLGETADLFRESAERARRIAALETHLVGGGVLSSGAIGRCVHRLCENAAARPYADLWSDFVYSIEGIIRLDTALDRMPGGLSWRAIPSNSRRRGFSKAVLSNPPTPMRKQRRNSPSSG
jgi:hypothetical protein